MKTLNLIVILLCFAGLTSCNSQNKKADAIKYPIEITDNVKKIKETSWGYDFRFKREQTIKTFPVKKRILMDKNGNTLMFKLSKAHVICGDTLPTDSKIRMYTIDIPFAYDLSEPTLIRGFLISDKKMVGNGTNIDFYKETNTINWMMPANNEEIDGILCLGEHCIKLYPDRKLHVCTLAKDISKNGETYKAYSNIVMDKEGIILPASGLKFVNLMLPWATNFYEDGKLKRVILAFDQYYKGMPCKKGEELFLYPNGNIQQCILFKGIEIKGINYKAKHIIKFDEEGKILVNKE